MIAGILLKRALPFLLAATVGILLGSIGFPSLDRDEPSGIGYGSGREYGSPTEFRSVAASPLSNGLIILSKPKAVYTDLARDNNVQGKVILRVTLQADGTVGSIKVLEGLPDGLTEQAIAATRQIKFRPATVDGEPVSKTVTIQYGFEIY